MTLDAILKLIITIANLLLGLHTSAIQQATTEAHDQGRAQGMAEMEAKYIVQAQADQARAARPKQDA